jgi:hypothetical protein
MKNGLVHELGLGPDMDREASGLKIWLIGVVLRLIPLWTTRPFNSTILVHER